MRLRLIAAALAAGFALPAAADEATLLAELRRLAARVEALERHNAELARALASERISEKEPELATRVKYAEAQLDALKGPASKLAEAFDGVTVEASLIAVAQKVGAGGTASGTAETRGNYRGDLGVSLPLGSSGDAEGRAFAQIRFGQGNGVATRPTLTGTINSTTFETGAGADDSFAILAQAGYELVWPLGRGESFTATVGKLDIFGHFDQNRIADDEGRRFLNNVFVHNPLLDSGGDIHADAYGFQPGAVLKYANDSEKGSEWALSFGAFGGGGAANFADGFGDPLAIAQFETNARLAYLPGSYRLYAWHKRRATDFDGSSGQHGGWGFSLDQQVLEDLTLFARYGHQTHGRVAFDRALTLGAELTGTPWNRSADALGLALGQLQTTAAYRASLTAAADRERQLELYYRYQYSAALELTPNLQWISRPGGDAEASRVSAIGLRARLGF